MMQYKNLGNTDLKVSSLCCGTMTFGDGADMPTCKDIYAKCRSTGINFFDCANVYADGESERILGQLVRDHRSDVVVTTKAYYPMRGDAKTGGLGRNELTTALNASLKRLGTDYVDIYYMHAFDETIPLQETLAVLDEIVKQGKVRHIGASNFAAWQVMKALSVAEGLGYQSISCIQPMYNLLKRQCETELLPMARSEGLAVVPYGPVAGGFLTGKYLRAESGRGRLSRSTMYEKRYADPTNRLVTKRFVELAQQYRIDPASLAIAWVASNAKITAPIFGARNLAQLDTALSSLDISMSLEMRKEIESLSPRPAVATDRTEEQN